MNSFVENKLVPQMADYIDYMSKHLSDDVYQRIKEMRDNEIQGSRSASVYDSMLENLRLSAETGKPLCQDTGILQFFVNAGGNFPYLGEINAALTEAVRIASEKAPLRPNAIEPFTDRNTGNNIAKGSPYVFWNVEGDGENCEIEVYMAGGGSSLPGKAIVLMPSAGYDGVMKTVIDVVCDRGINACPPLMIGVGIANSCEVAGILSKQALLRPVKSENPDSNANKMEKLLFQAINEIGIGPNALGGKESVLSVHVEAACHHPATLAVGVSVGCWATRRGFVNFDKELNMTVASHGDYCFKGDEK